ncbi:MAG: peptidylprolyl isomerase [Clostridia bacterium]|nr:peptidylprolyl isomerase [Clostridia bacterium]
MASKKQKLNYAQRIEYDKNKAEAEKKKHTISHVVVPFVTIGIVLLTVASVVTYVALDNSGVFLRQKIAMSTKDFEVNDAMMTYYVQDTYDSYLENFADSLSSDGLDTSTDLESQDKDSDQTWRDFFIQKAEETVHDMLIMAQSAKDSGFELTQSELDSMEDYLDDIDLSKYPKGITLDDIRDAEMIYRLAIAYDEDVFNSFTYNDTEVDSYYNDHALSYNYFDYRFYALSYSLDSDEDDFTISKEEAAQYAEKLKSSKDEEEFKSHIAEFCRDMAPDITDSQIENELYETCITDSLYIDDDPFSEWVFESGRKVGDIYYEHSEEDQTYVVFYLKSLPQRKEKKTVNVRHILFSVPQKETAYLVLENASKVLTNWELNGKKEEEFAELAQQYSEDNLSAINGGLMENVAYGETTEQFNAWCFDEERKKGDYEIIQTEYGYHIMYYVGEGIEQWRVEVSNDMIENDYLSFYEDKSKEYNVEISETYKNEIKFN